MSIADRLGLVVKNVLVLIPVFIVIVVSAILSAVGAKNLSELDDSNKNVERASKMVTNITIALWSILVIGFILTSIIGLFIIQIPYLYGTAMIIYSLVNLALAGILFYASWAIRTSTEYKDPKNIKNVNAQSAFNNLLICGILMLVAAIFTFIYAIYIMQAYSAQGGLSADAEMLANVLAGNESQLFTGLVDKQDDAGKGQSLSQDELINAALGLLRK